MKTNVSFKDKEEERSYRGKLVAVSTVEGLQKMEVIRDMQGVPLSSEDIDLLLGKLRKMEYNFFNIVQMGEKDESNKEILH